MRWPWSKRRSSSAPRRARTRTVQAGHTRYVLDPRPTVKSARQRCEYCHARAKVRADFQTGPLYFCGHHAYSMWSPLADKAKVIAVDDSRDMHWLPRYLFADDTRAG